MTRAFIALGSNLGDRLYELRRAVRGLDERVACSSVFETDPVGGPANQGPYLNMIVQLETDRSPRELLETCQALEQAAHRERLVRWGPRTLDVDIVWIDGVTLDEPDLQVPHPRYAERSFVLAPLAELAPDIVAPGWEDGFERLGIHRLGSFDELVT